MLRRLITPSGRAHAVRSEGGLTLIEVMIAMFVLAVAVLALASTAAASLTSLRTSRERQQATAAASGAIEELRALGYSELAHPRGEVTGSSDPDYVTGSDPAYFAHDDVNDEEIVASSSGEVSPHRWTSSDGRLTVRVFVTWYDDDATPAGRDAKRVTAIAVWDDPQTGPGEVRQSTVVAAASRGLPVPRFEITPDDQERHADVGGRVCFTHLMRNTGATDTYDWQLINHGGNPGTYVNAYTMRANGWEAQAWFGEPKYKDDGEVDTTADNLWRDTTGNGRMDSPSAILSGGAAVLTTCYTSKNASAENHSKPDLRFVVRSAFDQDVSQTVFNRIDTLRPTHRLYLHNEPDNLGDHERTLGDPYPMDPGVPIQQQDDGTLLDELFDYDTNIDPDGRGGIMLARNEDGTVSTTTHTGIWTYNGLGAGTVLESGELDLWVWHGPVGEDVAEPTFRIEFALDLVTGTGDLVEPVTVSPSSFEYGPGTDWVRATVGFDIVDDPTIGDDDHHLRLRVWCTAADAVGDCHLAYDTNTYRSSLLVNEP